MSRVRITEVLRFLEVEHDDYVLQLREEGLFLGEELDPQEAEELRVAVSLMRDLGVNPAGVEVALHLRRRLSALEQRLAKALEEFVDER